MQINCKPWQQNIFKQSERSKKCLEYVWNRNVKGMIKNKKREVFEKNILCGVGVGRGEGGGGNALKKIPYISGNNTL